MFLEKQTFLQLLLMHLAKMMKKTGREEGRVLGGARSKQRKAFDLAVLEMKVVAVNYMWSGERRHSPTPFLGGGAAVAAVAAALLPFGRVLGALGLFFGVKQLLLWGAHCPGGGPKWSLRA